MDKTVPRSVSVTTMAFVCRRPEGASAAPGTLENGNIWQYCAIYSYYLHIYFSCKTTLSEFTLQSKKLRSHYYLELQIEDNFMTIFNKVFSLSEVLYVS